MLFLGIINLSIRFYLSVGQSKTNRDMPKSVQVLQCVGQKPHCSFQRRVFLSNLDLLKITERRSTFPYNFAGDVGAMSRDGWFYLQDNWLQCAHCWGIERWHQEFHSLSDHIKAMRWCEFAQKRQKLCEEIREVCDGATPQNSAANQVAFPIRRPCFFSYESLEVRKLSFQNVEIDTLSIPADRLAASGFFYIGPGDRVKCYYCARMMQNFTQNHDPWISHFQYSSRCNYVLRCLGDDITGKISEIFGKPFLPRLPRLAKRVVVNVIDGTRTLLSAQKTIVAGKDY